MFLGTSLPSPFHRWGAQCHTAVRGLAQDQQKAQAVFISPEYVMDHMDQGTQADK